ncbi:hypothetical protein AB0G35_18970 [Streptomyces sp. NPDC021749]|uniref:hypothetical protein n=1 Tax=Streptomyces sp. NPDC021749 TaxID=3154905 RepID=UPI00341074D7
MSSRRAPGVRVVGDVVETGAHLVTAAAAAAKAAIAVNADLIEEELTGHQLEGRKR